jgi:hypothetical protein
MLSLSLQQLTDAVLNYWELLDAGVEYEMELIFSIIRVEEEEEEV